jgi:hypothetical protein
MIPNFEPDDVFEPSHYARHDRVLASGSAAAWASTPRSQRARRHPATRRSPV